MSALRWGFGLRLGGIWVSRGWSAAFTPLQRSKIQRVRCFDGAI